MQTRVIDRTAIDIFGYNRSAILVGNSYHRYDLSYLLIQKNPEIGQCPLPIIE
mgnify:CR=1 FL=1